MSNTLPANEGAGRRNSPRRRRDRRRREDRNHGDTETRRHGEGTELLERVGEVRLSAVPHGRIVAGSGSLRNPPGMFAGRILTVSIAEDGNGWPRHLSQAASMFGSFLQSNRAARQFPQRALCLCGRFRRAAIIGYPSASGKAKAGDYPDGESPATYDP